MPDEAKPLYLDKVKSLESGFNRKFEDLAPEKKALKPFRGFLDLFKPFEQDLATVRTTAEQYIRQPVATALSLRQAPGETIKALAQNHGVALNALVGKPAGADTELDEFTDPAVKAFTEKVHFPEGQLRDQATQTNQTMQTARQADAEGSPAQSRCEQGKRAGRTVASKSTPASEAPAVAETWKGEVDQVRDEVASA